MATIKKVKKAADGIQKPKKPTPTYKNLRMGVKNENYLMSGQNRDIKPSSKDSARYRGGFEQGLKGMKGMPNEGQVEKMGRWEGQNVGKKPKAKSGKMLKKQAATAIAMKAAGKKPKSMMKMGGSLKPVDKAKNPGLSKLPTEVRNKMGYQKMGGKTTASMMKKGGKMSKMSKKK